MVRSRDKNLGHDSKFKLGFCDNPKRLNVAISRAKELLVIVGNAKLFGSYDPKWNELLTYPTPYFIFGKLSKSQSYCNILLFVSSQKKKFKFFSGHKIKIWIE